MDSLKKSVSRRQFLSQSVFSAAAMALPGVVPATVLGKNGRTVPSEKITVGTIGNGPRCTYVINHFMMFDDVKVLAICDAQRSRRQAAKKQVDKYYKNQDCTAYEYMFDLLARNDIDAVYIATGDRMHAIASILAAKAGKDVYSEKPMTLTIEEGRALVNTMKRYGTVYQCGHQRRSVDSYQFQVEIAQSGLIGKVHTVIARSWANPVIPAQGPQPIPDGFNYDLWLGPTPWHPFIPNRVNNWNYFWDTGAGILVAMGCHYTDIAQWGLKKDDTGPVTYEGTAYFDPNNFADVPVTAEVVCTYADGIKLIQQSRGLFAERFIRFIGDKGWIQVDDDTNLVTAEPKSLLKRRGISSKGWAMTGNHIRNFIDCIKTRQETVSSPEKSHRATTVAHVANIALRLNRKLQWDPARERFVNDPEANRMLSRSMRPPWTI